MHDIIIAIVIIITIVITTGHHLLQPVYRDFHKHCWVMEVVATVIHALIVLT